MRRRWFAGGTGQVLIEQGLPRVEAKLEQRPPIRIVVLVYHDPKLTHDVIDNMKGTRKVIDEDICV